MFVYGKLQFCLIRVTQTKKYKQHAWINLLWGKNVIISPNDQQSVAANVNGSAGVTVQGNFLGEAFG